VLSEVLPRGILGALEDFAQHVKSRASKPLQEVLS
jgi:hypothetical protein